MSITSRDDLASSVLNVRTSSRPVAPKQFTAYALEEGRWWVVGRRQC